MSAFLYVAGKNDDEARDRAFYLLKKYTSATLLRHAIALYREFLSDFEREINRPEVEIDYSGDLVRFMRFLQPMEYAEPLLTIPARRPEAFDSLRDGLAFHTYIWGRKYEELGADDPSDLFYKIGYRKPAHESLGTFGKANRSADFMSLLYGTLNKKGRIYFSRPIARSRSAMCWTYESIFFDALSFNGIPAIHFPTQLSHCPPPNENTTGEVWSGRQIPVTGIWEPWSIDPKIGVRCPNYYLAGDTASQYQFEGTDTLEDVRWRLIWKDTRYADGTIPYDEREYFAPPPPVIRNRRLLTARPGDICPRSGEWFSHHLNRRVTVKAGEPMPGPERGKTGAVIWYLELND
ncbi:Imm72 family immunity protein [Caballeronia sp. LZ062]|uniref:Imm72 family immunity protein n=1 Tax=unclassified Caballeronia TaxID=2646786 RepID=UPI002861E43D|nr:MULTISPECIES: Imm72 family immunity protein [unclassified Caballeronia]MDR5854832.1 Imm72 family immunity protein [Caballeronia sp. LZ050]MDR5870639.1 Imm72 family immunity protein [Caballeronia sp. LZ062]